MASALSLILALGAAACGDDDAPSPGPGATTAPSADPTATTPTEREDGEPAPHPAVTRPYSAGDAGRVLIALEEGRLRLVGVDESSGWAHSVRRDERERVTVIFIDADREVVFDARLEDGEVRVELGDEPG